jgi:hypothetical protein
MLGTTTAKAVLVENESKVGSQILRGNNLNDNNQISLHFEKKAYSGEEPRRLERQQLNNSESRIHTSKPNFVTKAPIGSFFEGFWPHERIILCCLS